MTRRIEPRPSSPIASFESAKNIFLAAYSLVKVAEKEDFEGAPLDLYLEEKDNGVFLNQWLLEESSKEEYSSNEEEQDDDNRNNNSQAAQPL